MNHRHNDIEQRAQSWLNANWKWLVPVVGTLFLVVLGLLMWLFMSLLLGVMKNSYVYKHALEQVKSNVEVQQRLGQPIEEGYFISGSFSANNQTGNAHFIIPISGSKAKGEVAVVAIKNEGEWIIKNLLV